MIEIQNTLSQVSQTIGSSFEAITHIFDDSQSENKTATPTTHAFKLMPIGDPRVYGHKSGGSSSASSCRSSSQSSSSGSSTASDRSAFIAKDLERKRKQWKAIKEGRSDGSKTRSGSMADQFANMVDRAREDGAYTRQQERIWAQKSDCICTEEKRKDFEAKVCTVKKGYETVSYLCTSEKRVDLCDTASFWHVTGHARSRV